MMKKLLVLALVLSAVSMVNAGLVTTHLVQDKLDAVVDTDAKTISFVSLATTANAPGAVTGLAINMILNVTDDTANIGFVSAHAGIGMQAEGFVAGPGDWAAFGAGNANGVIGTLVTFSYTGAPSFAVLYSSGDWGDAAINIRGEADAISLDGMVVNIVPEPMTMILLGLGGLFLRRK